MSAAAGMVVTEMNTPMSAFAPRLRERHHPDDPCQRRDDDGEHVRRADQAANRSKPSRYAAGVSRVADHEANTERHDDRGQEAQNSASSPARPTCRSGDARARRR